MKLINFDGAGKNSAITLNIWISQGSVATQLGCVGTLCNCYIVYQESASDRITVFWDTVYIQRKTQNVKYGWFSVQAMIRYSTTTSYLPFTGTILYRFRDIASYFLKVAIFATSCISHPRLGISLRLLASKHLSLYFCVALFTCHVQPFW